MRWANTKVTRAARQDRRIVPLATTPFFADRWFMDSAIHRPDFSTHAAKFPNGITLKAGRIGKSFSEFAARHSPGFDSYSSPTTRREQFLYSIRTFNLRPGSGKTSVN